MNQPAAKPPKPFWSAEFRDGHRNGFNAEQEEALWNDRDPAYIIAAEKPVHRRMADLALQGFTHQEIGALLGYDARYISNILRQPPARRYMIDASKKPIQEEVSEFLESELMANLQVLKAVRDDPNAKPADRIAAAEKLIDRRLGRAVQPFANVDKPAADLTPNELQEEVAKILAKHAGQG